MTPVELNVTDRRVASLRLVSQGNVSYDAATARWLLDGHPAEGWDWRTFSEMQQADWIQPSGSAGVCGVHLTARGKKILSDA